MGNTTIGKTRGAQKAPTVRDVAAKAGVSFSTVAKVLRGEKRFSAETENLVRNAAVALGYRPNRAASLLAGSKGQRHRSDQPRMALVLFQVLRGEKFEKMQEAVDDRARALGLDPFIERITKAEDLEKRLDQLYFQGVEGLLLCNRPPDVDWDKMNLERFSVVSVGRNNEPFLGLTVRPHVAGAIRECYHRLESAGCRRIGGMLRHHRPLYLDDRARRGAYLDCWCGSHPESPPPGIFAGPYSDRGALRAWIEENRLDGIVGFCGGDYYILRDCGFEIPRDLRFAAAILGESFGGMIAGVSESSLRNLLFATDVLDHQLRLRNRGLSSEPVDYVIPGLWLQGKSVGRMRRSAPKTCSDSS